MAGTTLRELITRWRFKTDSKPVNVLRGSLTELHSAVGLISTGLGIAKRAATAAAGVIWDLSKAAGAAEESESKFAAVFKDSSKDVRDWSERMAKAANRSAFELREQASTFGALFNALGFGGKESANLSTHLSKLTEDLASFNDEAAPDVLIALRSGLLGNVEPVLKYGADVRVAAVNQELLNMGIKGGAKRATEQQKVLARLNIIMRATKDAQGDAVRTSGSFTNQLKGLQAVVKDLKINIGNRLLPVITPLIKRMGEGTRAASEWVKANQKFIDTEIKDALEGIKQGFQEMYGGVSPDDFKGIGKSIGSMLANLAIALKWIVKLGKFSWDGVRAVTVALAEQAAWAVVTFERIATAVDRFFAGVAAKAALILDPFALFGEDLRTALTLAEMNIAKFFTGVYTWIAGLPAALWTGLADGFRAALASVVAQVNAVKGKLGKAGDLLFGAGQIAMGPLAGAVPAAVGVGAGGGGSANVTVNNSITVPPGTPASVVSRVGDAAGRESARTYRRGLTDVARP